MPMFPMLEKVAFKMTEKRFKNTMSAIIGGNLAMGIGASTSGDSSNKKEIRKRMAIAAPIGAATGIGIYHLARHLKK